MNVKNPDLKNYELEKKLLLSSNSARNISLEPIVGNNLSAILFAVDQMFTHDKTHPLTGV